MKFHAGVIRTEHAGGDDKAESNWPGLIRFKVGHNLSKSRD